MIDEKFTVPITEMIFIGNEKKDRKTAYRANCQFIRIQRVEKQRGSINNLYELLEVLP